MAAFYKLYDIFRKDLHLPAEKAKELVQAIEESVKFGYDQNVDSIATKAFVKDEIHRLELTMTKAIFWTSLVQFLAIVGSVIGIMSFVFRE